MTDHRDNHEAYAITPPPAVAAFQTRIAQLLAEAQSKVSMALESSRLSEDEVRRLRARCEMEASHIAELENQISSLRAGLQIALDQRDEARLELCMEWMLRGRTYTLPNGHKFKPSAKDWAKISNWDCCKEETDDGA